MEKHISLLSWLLVGSFGFSNKKKVLSDTIKALINHKWCVVKPAYGFQWFTSDHPVGKLNYYSNGTYDLRGGWGVKGTNIFLPLSPHHMLFTEVGKGLPDTLRFNTDHTRQFQRYIAEGAMRWIFTDRPLNIIKNYRQRHINEEAYLYEKNQRCNWHKDQKQAENENKK